MNSTQTRNRAWWAAAICVQGLCLGALTGCDSAASGASAGSGPAAAAPVSVQPGGPGPVVNPAPAPPVASVGESCTSGDSAKICLALHFVAYQDPTGQAVATPAQAATIVHTINGLWSQCDIGFQIESYEAVDPTKYSLQYGAAAQNELDQIRTDFSSPSDELLVVTTGPWNASVNAWTNMPGNSVYGSILEASIVDYGGGIIYGHELGHYLGLDHVSDVSNLMNPVIYTTSSALDSSQCQTAVNTAGSYWPAMIRK